MRALVVLVLSFAVFCASASPLVRVGSCADIKDQATCDKSSQNDTTPCSWCVSHALPSQCVTLPQAKKLPPTIFSCDIPGFTQDEWTAALTSDCYQIKNPNLCTKTALAGAPCATCAFHGTHVGCFDEAVASRLPSGYMCTPPFNAANSAMVARAVMGESAAVQIFIGVAEGIVNSVLPNLSKCVKDVYSTYTSFSDFSQHLHPDISDVKSALKDLASGLRDFSSALDDCDVAEISSKVAAFVAKVESVIGDIVVATEIVIDGINIYEDLRNAASSFESGNYLQCGYDIGDVIKMII